MEFPKYKEWPLLPGSRSGSKEWPLFLALKWPELIGVEYLLTTKNRLDAYIGISSEYQK